MNFAFIAFALSPPHTAAMARVGAGRYRQKIAAIGGNSAGNGGDASGAVVKREEEVPLASSSVPSASSLSVPPSSAEVSAALTNIRVGQSDQFFLLLQRSSALINTKDDTGATPLHWFALRGEEANVRRAILLGATIDAKSNTSQTPLMWAVINGHTRIVDCLIGNGADVCSRDSLGATPLILSLQHSHTLLFLKLLDYGADPRQADFRGCTVAHWAAYRGQLSILRAIRSLLGWQAMVEEDEEGYAPIHRAARGGSLECIEFLVEECGIDPRVRAGDTKHNGIVAKHAGNSIGVGIGWCHPTTAVVDSRAKKEDEEAGGAGSGSNSTSNSANSNKDDDEGEAARASSSSSSSSSSASGTEVELSASSSLSSSGSGVLGRGVGVLGRSLPSAVGSSVVGGSRRPAPFLGRTNGTAPLSAAEALPPVTFGGEKDSKATGAKSGGKGGSASAVPSSSPSSSASASSPSSAGSAGSPLDMAEDALRLMVSSFESGGEYAGRQQLIKDQRALCKYLRGQSELYNNRDRSFIGKLAFAYHVHGLPRIYGRLYVPGGFCAMLIFAFSYWALKINGAAPSPALSLFAIVLMTVVIALYLRLYFGGAGALDPYRVLGPDRWFSTSPMDVIRHPHADPRGYGSDRFRPSGTQHLTARERKLMERFKETRLHVYERQLLKAPPSSPTGSSAAAEGSAAAALPTPRKANGEVDYEALVEMQLSSSGSSGSGSGSGSNSSSSAPGPSSVAEKKKNDDEEEDPLFSKSSAVDECNDLHYQLDEQEANAISVGTGSEEGTGVLGPLGRLFEDVRRQSVIVRRAWGPFADIGLPGGAAGMAYASQTLQKAFKSAADVTESVNSRICISCGILKPLRAKHDSTTDRCYDRYDHFCIWLGSPVTAQNFRLFMLFLILLITVCTLGLSYGWWYASVLAFNGDLALAAAASSSAVNAGSGGAAAAGAAGAAAAVAAPELTFGRTLRYLFGSSWQLAIYTIIVLVGVGFPLMLLYRHSSIMVNNVTLNEARNMQRFTHFQTLKVQALPAAQRAQAQQQGMGMGAGEDKDVSPAFDNPFDLKDKWKNTLDLLEPSSVNRVTFSHVAARDRDYLEEGVRLMAGQMSVEIKKARDAVQEEIDRLSLESLSSSSGSGAGGVGLSLSTKDDPALALAGGVFGGAGALPGAANAAPSREQVAAVAFLNSKIQQFPVLVGMAMAGQIDLQKPDLRKLLASLPEEVSSEVVRKRIMTMRATLIVKKAWEVMWYQTLAAQQARSHGHSHGGGGGGSHGHSHGGGGGGGGSHGHSHGAATAATAAPGAGAGAGSHGHSHNGQPCEGHGHA